jgi:hypothetical protein
VSEEVELYYNELKWQGPPEYLCVECQKKAFHFHVKMLILGSLRDRTEDEDKCREAARQMIDRILKFAKKNRISEEYVTKLLAREAVNLAIKMREE